MELEPFSEHSNKWTQQQPQQLKFNTFVFGLRLSVKSADKKEQQINDSVLIRGWYIEGAPPNKLWSEDTKQKGGKKWWEIWGHQLNAAIWLWCQNASRGGNEVIFSLSLVRLSLSFIPSSFLPSSSRLQPSWNCHLDFIRGSESHFDVWRC